MARSKAKLRGRLESFNLSEIVQTVTLGCKTGMLTLRNGRLKGRIWFEEGKARHAETGEACGEQAFITMVGWASGDFVLLDGKRTDRRTLDQDAMLLVMEGLRQLDERGIESLPGTPRTMRTRSVRLTVELAILVVALVCLIVVDAGRRGGKPARSTAGSVAFGAPTWDAQLRTAADVASGSAVMVFDALDPELYRDELLPRAVEVDRRAEAAPVLADSPVVAEQALETLFLEPESTTDASLWMAPPPVEEEGHLAITGASRIKKGRLTILVNDRVVYEHELASKRRRLFRRKVAQTFETTIPMEEGTHEVVARLHVEGKSDRYENRLTVEVEPGTTRGLSLFAGRGPGGPLSMELD